MKENSSNYKFCIKLALDNAKKRINLLDNSNNYKFCIKLALDNAKKRINLLEDINKMCVVEEYREWLNDGLNKHTVLLLRDDPII